MTSVGTQRDSVLGVSCRMALIGSQDCFLDHPWSSLISKLLQTSVPRYADYKIQNCLTLLSHVKANNPQMCHTWFLQCSKTHDTTLHGPTSSKQGSHPRNSGGVNACCCSLLSSSRTLKLGCCKQNCDQANIRKPLSQVTCQCMSDIIKLYIISIYFNQSEYEMLAPTPINPNTHTELQQVCISPPRNSSNTFSCPTMDPWRIPCILAPSNGEGTLEALSPALRPPYRLCSAELEPKIWLVQRRCELHWTQSCLPMSPIHSYKHAFLTNAWSGFIPNMLFLQTFFTRYSKHALLTNPWSGFILTKRFL